MPGEDVLLQHRIYFPKLYAAVQEACGQPLPAVAEGNRTHIITRINRIPVTTLADFQRVIDSLKPGDAVVLNLSIYFRPENRITTRIVQFTYQ